MTGGDGGDTTKGPQFCDEIVGDDTGWIEKDIAI